MCIICHILVVSILPSNFGVVGWGESIIPFLYIGCQFSRNAKHNIAILFFVIYKKQLSLFQLYMKAVIQKLKREEKDAFSIAEKYYSLLSVVNNLKLTTREIQLVAFAAIRGNISYANIRKDFCSTFGTTNASINNIISKLKRMGVLVKDGTKVKVNPIILLNFENPVFLEIKLVHRQTD